MQGLCYFCGKPITRTQPTVKLVIGLVHEKCNLKNQRDFFKERLIKISRFPKILESCKQMNKQLLLMLENIIGRGIHRKEQKEFCREWRFIDHTLVMELNLNWMVARHYIAQESALERFLSTLKGYPIVMAREPSEIQEWNQLMIEIIHAVTTYSIGENFKLPLIEKARPKEDHIRELKKLVTKFDKVTSRMMLKAKKDFDKYSKKLKEDHAAWLKQNYLKLIEYRLISGF